MNRMKSAYEKAMERVEKMERPDENQRLEWKLLPEGRKLGATFLKKQGAPFSTIEVASTEHRPYLKKGMAEVLVSNIQLPKNEVAKDDLDHVVAGLERLMGSKSEAKELLKRVRYVSDQYWQHGIPQRKLAYAEIKLQMEQQVAMAMSRQGGAASDVQINVETMPEFQQEWLRIAGQIDQQYEQHMEEFRTQVLELV